jgi:transcription termination factor Rho
MSPRPRKSPEASAAPEVAEAPKRRGRPPKVTPTPEPSAVASEPAAAPAAAEVAPKRRGRTQKMDAEPLFAVSTAAPAAPQVTPVPPPAPAERERVPAPSPAAYAEEASSMGDQDGADERAEEERSEDGNEGRSRGEGEERGRDERGRRGRRGNNAPRRGGFNFRDLQGKILPELHLLAKEVGLDAYREMSKDALVVAILERVAESEGLRVVQGYLEISSDGYGFLQESLLHNNTRSVIVSAGLIKQFRLRTGDMIMGKARRPRDNERYGTLIRVEAVNGVDPFQAAKRPKFDDLVPTFPDTKITLEMGADALSARVIDLLAPIGRGQRGLIVAPPKAGKTTLLKAIAKSVVTNEPDIKVIVLLVDERPEEVTDFRESVTGVEVIASTFDEPPANHIRVAEFVHERARRIVEDGGHVMILLDSITRLARANNLVTPATGRTLSGGLDSNALHWPKRFLGAARNIRGGGSLSILATALVETGSRMDDVIFEEFKGTGNMELHLSRRLEERRIFPAIDILKSGTRREDLLLPEGVLAKMWLLRKVISDMDAAEAMEMLLSRLGRTKGNAEFLATLGQG